MILQLYPSHDGLDAEDALDRMSDRALDRRIEESKPGLAGFRVLSRAEIRCTVDASPLAIWIYGRPGGEWGSAHCGRRRPPGRCRGAEGDAPVEPGLQGRRACVEVQDELAAQAALVEEGMTP